MLTSNLSAILTYFKAGEPYSILQQKVGTHAFSHDQRNAWLKSSGTLDLIGFIFKDINVTTSDILPTVSADSTPLATNRGKACVLDMDVYSDVNPCPKLEGYVVPKLGRFRGAVCHIHRLEDEFTLNSFVFQDPILGEYNPDLLQDILQRLYDLPYVLGMKSIRLDATENIKVNFQTGDIILDPRHLVDYSYIGLDEMKTEAERIKWDLRSVDPGGYISKLKPHPELKKSLCLYTLPEISKSISKEKIQYLLNKCDNSEEAMCLMSIGKTNELELVANYVSSETMRSEQNPNTALLHTISLFANYLSPQLPYTRFYINELFDKNDPYMSKRDM